MKTVEQSSNLWLDSLQANYLAESTLRKYRGICQLLCQFVGKDYPIYKIDRTKIDSFRASRKIGPSTAAHELQSLKSFFSWNVEQGFTPSNPALKMKLPHVPPNEKIPYTQGEMIRILMACDNVGQHDYERLRCKAAILTMRYTGLRISDVILLRKDAIRDGALHLQTKKTKAAINLPLPQVALNALAALPLPLCSNGPRDYFFWNQTGSKDTVIADMERVLHRVYILSGVPKAHNHRFRLTLASELAAMGANEYYVAHILGITPATANKHYVKKTCEFYAQVNALMGGIGRVHNVIRPLRGNNLSEPANFLDTVSAQEQTVSNLTAEGNYGLTNQLGG